MTEKTFGIQMRELTKRALEQRLAPKPKPVADEQTTRILFTRIKKSIESSANRGAYYCSYTLWPTHGDDTGILRSEKQALATAFLLQTQLEAEGIEAMVGRYIRRVSLELAWREKRSLSDEFET
ncbi:MAG: hypothetical protein A3J55_02110 [Candidatus Ryanbacteria bacterium RIFCSPHIGHO2_02_FULL_45_17b]|uniref:Uncharacterized protein n=1 Tax=Candidatus Ryanbacteria bacterium RIFCSPHIGHO2_01_FULL_45_22 TaxID=1802114 RepID=A0A1G2FYP2_9BACT|nr:MAG: hypothetical protein A2719_00555 [Candidatus Ryanbacteria bacterium RIFCSPHIGHO2_01_FULL_45_22]OGZ46734.1 MAG: hypothetical protein A3J55_02110 [Candidatus Ryanbacteria bacterium RIFCSPHIGHO2_02_FULL_45_17b]